MRNRAYVILVALAGLLLNAGPSGAASTTQPTPAAIIELHAQIDDLSEKYLVSRFRQAVQAGATTVILDIDTWGGSVTSALEISHFLKTQPGIRTIAYVNPKAISAGALISLACDQIVMAPRATIGDCAPIVYNAAGELQSLSADDRAKISSPIIADFTDSAQRNGQDATLVLAMVSANRVVRWLENPSTGERTFADEKRAADLLAGGQWRAVTGSNIADPIDDANTLLTLNSDAAIALGLARGEAASVQELVSQQNLTILRIYTSGLWEAIVEFLSQGWVRGILISIFFTCLYVALHAPGHGAAEVLGVVSLAVALGVPLLTGYAQWWEVIMIFLGIVLLSVELFLIPGFGVIGIAGILLIGGGLLLTFIAPEPGRSPLSIPNLPGTWASLQVGLLALVGALGGAILVSLLLRPLLPKMPMFRHLVLTTSVGTTASASAGSLSNIEPSDLVPALGAVGVAVSPLGPGGSVQFHDAAGAAHVVSVISDNGFVDLGAMVKVSRIDGPSIHVVTIPRAA